MQTISLHGKVSEDGILRLEVPYGAHGEEVEVLVVLQPQNSTTSDTSDSRNWVDESYGACADDPTERPEQGEWLTREDIV
jgi:hypothetical protein